MAELIVRCPTCRREHRFADMVPFRAECEGCAADLHVCHTCKHHDRYAENECREPTAEFVSVKDRRNLCEEWRPKDGDGGDARVDDAKAKLHALFGMKGPAPAPSGSASAPPPAEDPAAEAKRKLEALFKKRD